MKELRIAIVSDIHCGKLIEHRPGKEAILLLERFVKYVNENHFDVVLDLGDRINNESHDADFTHLLAVKHSLEKLKCRYINAIGNHDMHYLTKNMNKKTLGLESTYYSVFINGFELIVMDTVDPINGECGGHISEKQKQWLSESLTSNTLPKVIVSHHPLICQNQEDNPFFVRIPGQYKVQNNSEIQKLITKDKEVIACLNGHVHWFYVAKDNDIPYISVPSLVEAYPNFSDAPGRFATATITDSSIDVCFRTLNPDRALGRVIL